MGGSKCTDLIYRYFTDKTMKNWIEKHSVYIGAGLIVLSLIGGTLLMIKKGAWASGDSQNQAIENKDKEIVDLKNKIADLEKQIAEAKSAASSIQPSTSQTAGKININIATVSQLDSLPGIGPVYAQRIVDYRTANGPFTSLQQIKNIKGIGDKTFEKFRDLITI